MEVFSAVRFPCTGMMSTPKSTKSVAKEKEAYENKLLEKSFSVLEQVSNSGKKPAEDSDAIFDKYIAQSVREIKIDTARKKLNSKFSSYSLRIWKCHARGKPVGHSFTKFHSLNIQIQRTKLTLINYT